MTVTEEMAALLAVVEALDALGVAYALGGSLASAVHGVVRATMDAGLVADLRPEHAAPLARAGRRVLRRQKPDPRGDPDLSLLQRHSPGNHVQS